MKSAKKYAWVMDALSHVSLGTRARAMKHFLRGMPALAPKVKTAADTDCLVKCALCPNMCVFDCPVFNAEKNTSVSPSGKARIAHFFLTGDLEAPEVAGYCYACAGCDACRTWCPFDFSVNDLLRGVRADLARLEAEPAPVADLRARLLANRSTGGQPRGESRTGTGDILYFRGCTVTNDGPDIDRAARAVFKTAGVSVALIEDEWCCGAPLFNLGYGDDFRTFAEHTATCIRQSGCTTVVCSCPTCAYVMRQVYPSAGVSLSVPVLHMSEYLANLVQNGTLSLKNLDLSCVYHDPCTLARKLAVTAPPRAVLAAIPGVRVVEPFLAREQTQCCGSGGGLAHVFPETAATIARTRTADLLGDADTIVTACPTCKAAFVRQGGGALDLVEMVARSLEGNDG